MNPNRLLVVFLFAALACADRDEELLPHIVSIDRRLEEIDPELLWERQKKDNNVIVLNRDGFQTITVTFSSPPENVEVELQGRYGSALDAQDYILRGAELKITLYCTLYFQGTHNTLNIEWTGANDLRSSVFFPVWCPLEDPPGKEHR